MVRVHDSKASRRWEYGRSAPWDHSVEPRSVEDTRSGGFRKDRCFDHIEEDVVGAMFRRGLNEVFGSKTTGEAWEKILPGYRIRDKITIKINLNNVTSYDARITTKPNGPVGTSCQRDQHGPYQH